MDGEVITGYVILQSCTGWQVTQYILLVGYVDCLIYDALAFSTW